MGNLHEVLMLEKKIVQALRFFGPLNVVDLVEKLRLIGMETDASDVVNAISFLQKDKFLKESESKGITFYSFEREV